MPSNKRGRKKDKTPSRRKFIIGALSAGGVAAAGGIVVIKNIAETTGAALPIIRPPKPYIDTLDLSIEPYHILAGRGGTVKPVVRGLSGTPKAMAAIMSTSAATEVVAAINAEQTIETRPEFSGGKLHSARPLAIVVMEPRAGTSGGQVLPGERLVGPEGTDLVDFFSTGRFFDRDGCSCIHVAWRSGSGPLIGGPSEIYWSQNLRGPVFSVERPETTVDVTFRRDKLRILVTIEMEPETATAAARSRTALEQALKAGLEKTPTIEVSEMTYQELEARRQEILLSSTGPTKNDKINKYNVEYLLLGKGFTTEDPDWVWNGD